MAQGDIVKEPRFTNKQLRKMQSLAFKAMGPIDLIREETDDKPSIFDRYVEMIRQPMTLLLLTDELMEARKRIKELKIMVEVRDMEIKELSDDIEKSE
jgi:hypothetical protein